MMNKLLAYFTLAMATGTFALTPLSAEEIDHQSLLLRAVTVTCKVEESVAFYRDVMGQSIIEDVTFEGSGIQKYIDV